VSINKKTKRHPLVLRIRENPGSNPAGYHGRTFHDFFQAFQSDLHRGPTLNQAMIASFNILFNSLFNYLNEMNPNRRFHIIAVHRLPYVSRYAITLVVNMPGKIRAVLVRRCSVNRLNLTMTNFSDQSFAARCPESDKHCYR